MKKSILSFLFILILPVFSVCQFYKIINFDDGQNLDFLKIDNSNPSNIWQIGKPQKQFFDQAHSMPNAIVTDTVNSYPINNLSTFYLYIPVDPEPSMTMGQLMSFYYKVYSDSLTDFGKIEYSFNKGLSWNNLVPQPDSLFVIWSVKSGYPPYTKIYGNPDTINPFTGKSSGWYLFELEYTFPNWPITFDTVYYRFTFNSDGIQTNKDGLMLDDILLGEVYEGLESRSLNNIITVIPNPFQDDFTLNLNLENPGYLDKQLAYEIYSSMGVKIEEKQFFSKTVKIEDLRNCLPGIYFLRIYDEKQNISIKKIVKTGTLQLPAGH